LPLLCGEEAIAEVADREPIGLDPRGPAGVQVIGLGLVEFQGLFPAVAFDPNQLAVDAVGPLAEVVDLSPDLFLPGAAGVGGEGEVRIGLLRSVGRFTGLVFSSRLTGHGATSIFKGSGGVASGGYQPPGA